MNLREHLCDFGLREGDWLGVFGDVEAAGGDNGSALDGLIAELLAAVGNRGHILAPTFTLAAEFDRAKTPAATGHFAERFRQQPGVVRSNHPTHSVAVLGLRAHEIVCDHDVYLPFRPETPLGQLVANDGKVLLLGTDQRANALIHVARLSVARDWPVVWINVETVLEFGGKRRRRYVLPPCDRAYSALGPELESRGLARPFDTPWGRMAWMSARAVHEHIAQLERADPHRFLCDDSTCRWCKICRDCLG